jgi:hypothetical protein
MIPNHYPLRHDDYPSVPAVFGVLGPSSRSVLGSDAPYHPPIAGTVFTQHPLSIGVEKRRPSPVCSPDAHQRLYTPPSGAIFPGAGIPSGGTR